MQQSSKYGYTALPREISRELFEQLVGRLTGDALQALQSWYVLDENALPHGEYVLRDLADINDKSFWGDKAAGTEGAQSILVQALKGCAFDTEYMGEGLLVNRR